MKGKLLWENQNHGKLYSYAQEMKTDAAAVASIADEATLWTQHERVNVNQKKIHYFSFL